ncbi:4'-phosphopantetheinyl transferase family protein [Corynebacterium alimapuense]|uniref:4'-phosphopantetheinyl transferase n=1 Tax=Corynebacterium alimapuense TaxID=1576874 RepID=A0A3M8K826_9CORY|nr:4'-phosphopantetheinyl transferase superfamily protein [Corynebacterium alimapuense]RNE49373.1 4'-phosphopantetheinyl transferase [Corynebacterium alimapuense]
MIDAQLFPPSSKFCYVVTDRDHPDLQNYLNLHPLEQALVSRAVDIRKAEFGDARWCAHQALHELGHSPNPPILRGERGMPLWPKNVAGSLTHTKGFRAAVVAPSSRVLSMGLDAEPAEPLPPEVVSSIARPGEMAQLLRLRAGGLDCADRLLFCAKEATYKAWFPLTRRWLGFDEAEVDLREDGTFIAYLLVRPTPVPFIAGRWMVRDGYVIASTAVN